MGKLLTSYQLVPPEDPAPIKAPVPGPMSAHVDRPDLDFISRNATPADLAKLAGEIRRRETGGPEFSFWRCPKCGMRWLYPGRFTGREDLPAIACCNARLAPKGIMLVEVTKPKAIAAWKAEEAAAAAGEAARRERFDLFARNKIRGLAGLPEFSMEQFREDKAKRAAAGTPEGFTPMPLNRKA